MNRYSLNYEEIIKNVKALRKAKNISQLQLSELADLSLNTISRFEINQKQINLQTLIKIANALDVDVNVLLNHAKNSNPNPIDLIIENLLEDFSEQEKELLVPILTAMRIYKKNIHKDY